MVVNTRPAANGTRLEVRHLSVDVHRELGWRQAVRDVSFAIESGERVALVGESGSGKSLTVLSIARLLPQGARISGGEILLDGVDLTTADKKTLGQVRGKVIGFVFQNPMTSLDPLVRVGSQVKEALGAHQIGDRRSRDSRAVQMLERTGIHDATTRMANFPHQFSGGMQQRAMIAGALAADPSLLIADEPTTALDVTVQARVLALLKSLSEERALSLLMVTHDLAVASQIAERVIVMYAGRVLEDAPVRTIVERPHHPYTEALLALVPDLHNAVDLPAPIPGNPIPAWDAGLGCPFAARCLYALDECSTTPWSLRSVAPGHLSACIRDQASCYVVPCRPMSLLAVDSVSVRYLCAGKHFDAVHDVSFSVAEGEVLALVGESGSGKSTLARAIVGLTPTSAGSITFDGQPLPKRGRRPIGIVFQNPLGSLDTRMSVEKALAEVLQVHRLVPASQRRQRCYELLELVGLPREAARLKPGALSGGQQQRVSIARAMAAEPRILILDEPVSALDVSIRAQVLRLLNDLRSRLGIGLLFIGHDLAVVRQLADRVAVLYRGELVEVAPAEEFFGSPRHEYSRVLLESVPSLALGPS